MCTDAVGLAPFTRLVTKGVAIEHHWLDAFENSPFARLVFCETTGSLVTVTPSRGGYAVAFVKSLPDAKSLTG